MSAPTRELTPMLAQYWEIKRRYPDSILFYRMGDFYEMFFEDATTAAPVLEVQLTSRDKSASDPIPMCGIPHHSVSQYLQKLLNHGFKVAICDQVEDPATAKGIVKRDVTRVLTPALVADPDLTSEEAENILLCAHPVNDVTLEIATFDLLSGKLRVGQAEGAEQINELFARLQPKELLIESRDTNRCWLPSVLAQSTSLLVTERPAFFKSARKVETALFAYLDETQKISKLAYISKPGPLFDPDRMILDVTSLHSLEILKSASEDGPTLFNTLDECSTPMGRRALREWLTRPLAKARSIQERLDAVEFFFKNPEPAAKVKTLLANVRDLERLATKASLGLAMPRDLVSIREIQKAVPELKKLLKDQKKARLAYLEKTLDPLTKLTAKLDKALLDLPPATYRDGNIFQDSFHPDIQSYREISRDTKSAIASIETREKERTNIPTLKVKFNKVFGYTIEITNSHLKRVPKDYIRKQTISTGERYITEELKKFEEKVISAEHRLRTLEESLFLELRGEVAGEVNTLLKNASCLGELDVFLSFAKIARERGYTKPVIRQDSTLEIIDGRHPVIEPIMPAGRFIPNDIFLDREDCRSVIITGPNMGGKSTIMRQVALITLMTHAGSFVPAKKAAISLVDAIFTRIGSSDDLAHGRSTFMVEMSEVAQILSRATEKSLILIDEIGRGTSTYDGLSLAWSLLEYLHDNVRGKTLFATHFHELTSLANKLSGLTNMNVLVEKSKEDIVFLYKLAPGICNQSYGIEVARLAGLPPKVLTRAKDILGHLETQSIRGSRARHRALEIHSNQLAFLDDQIRPENLPSLES